MSLTIRLTLTYLLITLAGLLLLGGAAVVLAGRYIEQQRLEALGGQADLYAAYLAEVVGSAELLPGLAPGLVSQAALPTGVLARVFASNGSLLAGNRSLGPFPSRSVLPLVSSSLPLPISQVAGRRYVARPIGGQGGIGAVELSQPTNNELLLQRTLLRTVAQAALLAALVMGLVSLLVARSIARPITGLQSLAEALAAGSLDRRSAPLLHSRRSRHDEIGLLAHSLDRMAEQLQQRIAEAESERARLAAVLAGISEGVVAFDATGALLFANPAAAALLEAGSGGQEQGSGEEPGSFARLILAQLDALELPLLLDSPLEREVAIGDRQLLIVGTPLGYPRSPEPASATPPIHASFPATVWVIRDMTRLKALEQSRTRFLRSISHELRTPLTAIRGTLENLRDSAAPQQQGPLSSLEDEAARLARLVDELLRPSTDGVLLSTERRPVDVGVLVGELCALQQGRARRAGVSLRCAAVAGAQVVLGDRDRLKQALLNLLDNALKATAAGGEIVVTVKQKAASQLHNNQGIGLHGPVQRTIEIAVEDNGPGVPAELRERVWERGVSGGSLGLEDSGGAGLGLALVREIVGAHGGWAWVEERGQAAGARFVLELPVAG